MPANSIIGDLKMSKIEIENVDRNINPMANKANAELISLKNAPILNLLRPKIKSLGINDVIEIHV